MPAIKTPVKRKKRTAKATIEKTDKIHKLEMAWVKQPLKKLQEAFVEGSRGPGWTTFKKNLPPHTMEIHSHPNPFRANITGPDFETTIKAFSTGRARTAVIANMRKGKVAGYTLAYKTKRFKPIPLEKAQKMVALPYKKPTKNLAEGERREREYNELHKKAFQKLGIKIRYVPMKGFEVVTSAVTGKVMFMEKKK